MIVAMTGRIDTTSDHLERISTCGYTIIADAIEPELIAALTARIDALLDELDIPFGDNTFLGTRTRRMFNLLARDPLFAVVPVHPAVLPVVEGILDAECQLSSLTAIEINPGQAAQPFHADDGSIPIPRPHVPVACPAIWALTDFTTENGGTRVVPGSHRFERIPRKHEQPEEVIDVVMPAGSVLVYHGSLWHGGGTNQSAARRAAIVVNYCAGFLRQEENQFLALGREQVAGFPPRLQRLVGYSVYRGHFGHVNREDPATWVDPAASTSMHWKRFDD
jgi:ectoine hydroxylase-related dioxygenase (phytanoyl-CoA dioxygenase family)